MRMGPSAQSPVTLETSQPGLCLLRMQVKQPTRAWAQPSLPELSMCHMEPPCAPGTSGVIEASFTNGRRACSKLGEQEAWLNPVQNPMQAPGSREASRFLASL